MMRIRELSRKLPAFLLLAGAISAGVSTPSCKPRTSDDGGGLPRSETFYVAGRQWGEPVSFNPLSSTPDWPINGLNLMYETVLLYNPLSGKMEPLLAESFEQTENSL